MNSSLLVAFDLVLVSSILQCAGVLGYLRCAHVVIGTDSLLSTAYNDSSSAREHLVSNGSKTGVTRSVLSRAFFVGRTRTLHTRAWSAQINPSSKGVFTDILKSLRLWLLISCQIELRLICVSLAFNGVSLSDCRAHTASVWVGAAAGGKGRNGSGCGRQYIPFHMLPTLREQMSAVKV